MKIEVHFNAFNGGETFADLAVELIAFAIGLGRPIYVRLDGLEMPVYGEDRAAKLVERFYRAKLEPKTPG